jgi:uncharacterized membrane protein
MNWLVWVFTILGAIIGLALKEVPGMLALGFIGWVFGMIVKALFTPAKEAVRPAHAVPSVRPAAIDALERRVADLEKRLARLETVGTVAVPEPEPMPEPITEPLPEPIPESMPEPKIEPATLTQGPPPVQPPPPSRPRQPEPEPEPNFIVRFFTGGNTIVRVGLVILFFGLAFLVKYGVEHQLIPVELRIAAVAAVGIALLVVGWRLREKREGYALSLQGAGVAVLYLTVFGALRLYHLMPAGMAFFFLVAIAVLSAFLAIGQNSLALAVSGAAGGFLAPILASTGGGSHVMLFSYYLVLNSAIFLTAWFRAWRVLNIIGFLFTFFIGLAWGVTHYRDELFETTEPFLVAFFVMYVAIAILFARKREALHQAYVDGMIVFGVPIAAFGLQAGMLHDTEFSLAFTSIAMGALYLGLSAILRRSAERFILLAESFLALGIVFASLAIPLALDARWTSAAWAVEGAAVMWMGLKQNRAGARAFGMLLQFLAGISFLYAWPNLPPGPPLVDATFIGMLLVSLAGFFTHRQLTARAEEGSAARAFAPVFFFWALAWWTGAGVVEIWNFVDSEYQLAMWLLFASASTIGFALLAGRPHWEMARWVEWAFAPVMLAFAVATFFFDTHPSDNLGWIAWPIALAVHFATLRWDEVHVPHGWIAWPHALGAIVIAILGVMELDWLGAHYTAPHTAWALASRIVAPAIVLLAISSRFADTRWPVAEHLDAYRLGAGFPLVIAMAVWSLHINFAHAGSSDPLPYLPILNAIDLGHLLGIFAVTAWWLALRRSEIETPPLLQDRLGLMWGGFVIFIWLNAILLRTMHHWTGVAYTPNALMASREVQAALSIFWAALALALMLIATRLGRRALWVIGASLMGVVVVKLVLVDLSHLQGLERIVSFIGVGVLMLVIGYFSPVPPRRVEEAS